MRSDSRCCVFRVLLLAKALANHERMALHSVSLYLSNIRTNAAQRP